MFMREAIANTDCFTNYEKNDILWLKLAASLCSLDIYKHDVLSRAFDKNYITQVFKQRTYYNLMKFVSNFEIYSVSERCRVLIISVSSH